MPGIARSRRQPGSGIVGEQVDAAGGDLGGGAPQRERARHGARSKAASRAGAAAATPAGVGRVAQAGLRAAAAERGDQAALDRDRALELDQLLADRGRERLPRQRRAPRRAAPGARAARGRSPGRRGRPRGRAQVVVHARWRSAAAGCPTSRPSPRRARAANSTRSGARWTTADVDGRAVAVQQPLEAGRRAGAAGRRPSPPRRRNGHGGRTSTRTSATRRGGAPARPPPCPGHATQSRRIRWTSTRKELLETISPKPLPAPRRRRRAAAQAVPPRAPRDHDGGRRAGHEAGGGQGRGLDGRHRGAPNAARAPAAARPGRAGRRRPPRDRRCPARAHAGGMVTDATDGTRPARASAARSAAGSRTRGPSTAR